MDAGQGPVRVALDGAGAEQGPEAVVGAAEAIAGEGIELRVFGDAGALAALQGQPGVELIDTPEVIGNDEDPVPAVRSREDASVVRAAADVREGRSDALVSPGSTGATMAAALFALRRMRGVQRPALAVQLPVPGQELPTLLLDAGANSEARSQHLVQFAFMGSAFLTAVFGIERPRVALLSVGEEAKKGSPLVVEAHERLHGSEQIDFVGNLEGRDLLGGAAEVVVTDGFTGNVTLKTIEGTAKVVAGAVRDAARSGPRAMAGGLLLRPALGDLRSELDPDGTGGAILLGLRGVAVVGHGSAGPLGIANAVRLAARAVREDAIGRTASLLSDSGATRAGLREGDAPDADA